MGHIDQGQRSSVCVCVHRLHCADVCISFNKKASLIMTSSHVHVNSQHEDAQDTMVALRNCALLTGTCQ